MRRDIPPELVGVFNKVRHHIKGSDRKSRSEAFLVWAEENPGEIYALENFRPSNQSSSVFAQPVAATASSG